MPFKKKKAKNGQGRKKGKYSTLTADQKRQYAALATAKSRAKAKAVATSTRMEPVTHIINCSPPCKRTLLFSPEQSAPLVTPTPAADPSLSQASTRAALHIGKPSKLLCRENQVGTLTCWLDEHLVAGKAGSMYVSGAPGTGKTATLTHLLDTKKGVYRTIFINCMMLKSSVSIYREVVKHLAPKSIPKTEKDMLKVITNQLTTSERMTLLILDEVDRLDSKNQSVLYTVYEWPALKNSMLALIGISNSLDLTHRVLPRLQASASYKPTLLHYPPYTKQQIIDILTARIKEGKEEAGGEHPVITPRAIAFLAGKISSLSGDIRQVIFIVFSTQFSRSIS